MIQLNLRLIFPIIFLGILSCTNNDVVRESNVRHHESEQIMTAVRDTSFQLGFKNKSIDIKILPAGNDRKGSILALPGWNYPYDHWCDSTSLCELASERGYDLIMISTGKTIYQKEVYVETRTDWREELTLSWFTDSLFPFLREKFGLFQKRDRSFVMGLSTGARGAFILGKENPVLFDAVAVLSGDYDQNEFPLDNLYRGYFGTIDEFPARYKGSENPVSSLDELKVPLYIGHGELDDVVTVKHSIHLHELITSTSTDVRVELHIDKNGRHDYRYWNSEISNMLKFFDTITSE